MTPPHAPQQQDILSGRLEQKRQKQSAERECETKKNTQAPKNPDRSLSSVGGLVQKSPYFRVRRGYLPFVAQKEVSDGFPKSVLLGVVQAEPGCCFGLSGDVVQSSLNSLFGYRRSRCQSEIENPKDQGKDSDGD